MSGKAWLRLWTADSVIGPLNDQNAAEQRNQEPPPAMGIAGGGIQAK